MVKNNLQSRWQRHTWQASPFAPELRIVQAIVGGKTASGAGFSRYDAVSRCLGETAEIIALSDGESSEGLAAGPDFSFAASHALSERVERWALWEWWHGRLTAKPAMVDELIAKLRRGAVDERETSLWFLEGFPHTHVAIAFSCGAASTQPILGFGANICPQEAAQSALIELGLMELNLLAPVASTQAYFNRLQNNQMRLLPATSPRSHLPTPLTTRLESNLAKAKVNFTLHDRSPTGLDITVVKAEIQAAPSWMDTPGPLL